MIKVCYVHDVVHDFGSVKAKKEKLFKLMDFGAQVHGLDFLYRRLTIHTSNCQIHKTCHVLFNSNKSSAGSKYLLSLKVRCWLHDYSYLCHTRHLRLVRVLQLDEIYLKDSLMDEIGSLFHLRFLKIQTYAKALPLSWLNLQNLETLFIGTRHSTIVLLPIILKLSKLKHVSIDMSSFLEEEEEAHNKPSRILEAENSNLTTLSKVHISHSEGTSDVLLKFPNLEHLDCVINEPTDPPTHGGDWFPKLDLLNKLESLIATYHKRALAAYDHSDDDPELIPPPNEYYFPTSLKVLRLSCFPMTPALLSAIAALPQLEILVLIDSDFSEDKWDASEDIYQSLKTLHLVSAKFSKWQVDTETFPKLEELILEHCEGLTEIPCEFGYIDTLMSIRVVQTKRHLGNSAIEIMKDVDAYTGEERLDVHISNV